ATRRGTYRGREFVLRQPSHQSAIAAAFAAANVLFLLPGLLKSQRAGLSFTAAFRGTPYFPAPACGVLRRLPELVRIQLEIGSVSADSPDVFGSTFRRSQCL